MTESLRHARDDPLLSAIAPGFRDPLEATALVALRRLPEKAVKTSPGCRSRVKTSPRCRCRSPARFDRHASLERPVGELRAEHLLVELAHARLGDLLHERELVRQPPLGDA